MQTQEFVPGDVIELDGETYQVIENQGDKARIIPFPSDDTPSTELDWKAGGSNARRIGNAPLPAPTPCSATGECPTDGAGTPIQFVPRR